MFQGSLVPQRRKIHGAHLGQLTLWKGVKDTVRCASPRIGSASTRLRRATSHSGRGPDTKTPRMPPRSPTRSNRVSRLPRRRGECGSRGWRAQGTGYRGAVLQNIFHQSDVSTSTSRRSPTRQCVEVHGAPPAPLQLDRHTREP